MRLKEIMEASGYIPKNDKEAKDPRWEMAMTHDVKPGEDGRQAKKLGWKMGKDGKYQKMSSNGKVEEAVIDVAVQARRPVSPGARGLMTSTADYGHVVHDDHSLIKGAVDMLTHLISTHTNVDDRIEEVLQNFQIKEGDLHRAFHKRHSMSAKAFARKAWNDLKHSPIKI